MQRTIRSDPHRALMRALVARADGVHVESSSSQPWASVTFTGARHKATLRIGSTHAADRFAEGIDVAEFMLPGHILADIEIVARRPVPDGIFLDLEALTVEDS